MTERQTRMHTLLLLALEIIPLFYLSQWILAPFEEDVLLYTADTYPSFYAVIPIVCILCAVLMIGSLFWRPLIHLLLFIGIIGFVGILLPRMPVPFSIASTGFLVVLILIGIAPFCYYYGWRYATWSVRRRMIRELEGC